jgi:hypothetical protein
MKAQETPFAEWGLPEIHVVLAIVIGHHNQRPEPYDIRNQPYTKCTCPDSLGRWKCHFLRGIYSPEWFAL